MKKQLKKALILGLCFLLFGSLAACGKTEQQEKTGNAENLTEQLQSSDKAQDATNQFN